MESEVYDFGYRIQDLRKQCELTQLQAAERLGTSRGIISRYERNLLMPNGTMLARMALLYRTSIDYIMGIEPKPREVIDLEDVPPHLRPILKEMVELTKDFIHRKQHGGEEQENKRN